MGVELVRLLAAARFRTFSVENARDFSERAGIKKTYLLESLYHLRQTGWIIPLRRGLYALAPSVPGVPPAHDFEIAMALVRPAAISHWSALHHHGLTDQPPPSVFVTTTTGTAIPRDRHQPVATQGLTVAGVKYRFVQIKPDRFFGMKKVWVGEAQVAMTDRERTLVDGLSMPQLCGGLPEVLQAFDVHASTLNIPRIVEYALRLEAAIAKRLGWVLAQHGISSEQLQPLLDIPVKGFRRLDPTGPRFGAYNKLWRIQENLLGKL